MNTAAGPSFGLVAAHFGLGLLGLLAFAAALVGWAGSLEGHFFQPHVLALVHLCVLGWLLPVAIGALHQLLPVVLEAPLGSERPAWVGLALYVPGAATLIVAFATFATGPPLVAGALLLVTALAVYAIGLARPLWRAQSLGLTGAYVTAALLHLLVAAALGAALAWNLHAPYLPFDHLRLLRAHAHVAGLGFFGLLIMSVSYRLIEMFLLVHGVGQRPAWVAFVAVNAAVVALAAGFLLASPAWQTAGGLLAAVGLGAYLLQVARLLRARKRSAHEPAWWHTVLSLVYLAAALVLGGAPVIAPVLAPEDPTWQLRLPLAYGLLALPGFVGSIVVGQLAKIVPFLVWLHRFSPCIGLMQVPKAADLLPERPQWLQLVLMHGGLIGLLAGVLLGADAVCAAGAALFGASALLLTRNLLLVYRSAPCP